MGTASVPAPGPALSFLQHGFGQCFYHVNKKQSRIPAKISIEKNNTGTGEIPQWAKCLLCNHKALILHTHTPIHIKVMYIVCMRVTTCKSQCRMEGQIGRSGRLSGYASKG